MQIELIGCTGVGKSTLLRELLSTCRERGLVALSGDDYILQNAHLGWIKGYFARTLFVDILSISTSLLAAAKHMEFYRLICRVLLALPSSVNWPERLNILRNILKKVGIYEIVGRSRSSEQVVLLDEGTLHTAHSLFVHHSARTQEVDLRAFQESVPLPDAVVYLRQAADVLVERTMARSHRRIPRGSREAAERFVCRAMHMFDALAAYPAIAERLLVVDRVQHVSYRQLEQPRALGDSAAEILQRSLDIANPNHAADTAWNSTPAISG